MKKIFYISTMILALLLVSCGKDLADINIDPTTPSDVSLNLLLPGVQTQTAFNEGANQNRVAGIIMQQLFGLDAQQLAFNDYNLPASTFNGYWQTGLYSGVLAGCQVIIDKSLDADDPRPFYGAVAKIIMANEYGQAAANFGDIPLTEALQGTDILQPKYDTQESVYAAVQAMLSDAISTLEGLTDDGGYFGGDYVNGGDAAAWSLAAHAYKARYYMHTSKRNAGDYANAISEAQASFASNADAPYFQFESSETANWSLAKFGIERPSTLAVDDRFATMMDGDPRQTLYMELDASGSFYQFFNGGGGTLVWGRSDARIPLISYVETQFIMAEAMAATGGAGAQAAFERAIDASMELVGVDGGTYAADASADASVENIVTEAYKAYYGFNFHETWSNWRRTGFPALSSNNTASNGLNPSGAVPQRYIYVDSEIGSNSANVEAAQSSQGGGLLDNPVWAFQ